MLEFGCWGRECSGESAGVRSAVECWGVLCSVMFSGVMLSGGCSVLSRSDHKECDHSEGEVGGLQGGPGERHILST